MFVVLMLGSGLFWTVTYLLIIRQGARDRTYGMPLAALCANLSWEIIFSILQPPSPIQHGVNLVWLVLDLIIFAQLLRYGPREFADLAPTTFYALVGVALAPAFGAVLLTSDTFHDKGAYAAFGQNLMMSVLFIALLYRRRSLRGQSRGIAVCKLVGTALASLAFARYTAISHHSVLLPFLYVTILAYDALYVGLVYRQRHTATRNLNADSQISRSAEQVTQERVESRA